MVLSMMTRSVVTALTELGSTVGGAGFSVCVVGQGGWLTNSVWDVWNLRNHIQVELSSRELHNSGLEFSREAVNHQCKGNH